MVSFGDLTVLSRGVSANFMRDTPGVMRMIRNSPAYVDGVNVFALLGQTIGNYSPTERHSFFTELFSKMNGGDILLVDAGVRPEEGESADLDERLRNLELAYFREAGKFMQHKADHRSSRFRVAYDQSLHQMSHWFKRPDGLTQFLGYSYLFTCGELIGSLIDVGYRVTRSVFSLDEAGLHPGPECMVVFAEKPASKIDLR